MEADFPGATTDPLAIDHYLRHTGRADFVLVLNLADETCVPERLPPAGRRDRQALAVRRLASRFPGQSLVLAQLFADDALPRANLLLYAQTEAPAITTWRDALNRNDCGMAGIWPLAALMAAASRQPVLFACQTRTGLRITLALQGQFAFTRLAVDRAGDPLADATVRRTEEVRRTGVYLAAQGLMAESATTAPADGGACPDELACLSRFLLKRPARQLAPPAWRDGWHCRRSVSRLHLATLTALLLGGLCIAWMGTRLANIGERQRQVSARIATLQDSIRRTVGSREPAAIATAAALVRLDGTLVQARRNLLNALGGLGGALDRLPSLDLRYLGWEQASPGQPIRLVARLVCASDAPAGCRPDQEARSLVTAIQARRTGLTATAQTARSDGGHQQLEVAITVGALP